MESHAEKFPASNLLQARDHNRRAYTKSEKYLGCNSDIIHQMSPQHASLYYRVVVIKAPLQGLCYTVRDAVDW